MACVVLASHSCEKRRIRHKLEKSWSRWCNRRARRPSEFVVGRIGVPDNVDPCQALCKRTNPCTPKRPPLPLRLLGVGAKPVPGRELHPLKSSAFSRRTFSPRIKEWAANRLNRADGPRRVLVFWVEPYDLAFGR